MSSSALPLVAVGKTDRGRVREINEDGFVCDEDSALHAVADGLGGLPKGEVASSLALDDLRRRVRDIPAGEIPDWQTLFERINRLVVETGRKLDLVPGIGTTLTAVRATPGFLHLGHIGDSGVFVFPSPGKWEQVTKDQTMAQELVDRHGPAVLETMPESYHHTLTQCIGQPTPLAVERRSIGILPGSRVLLYTDGVTKTIGPEELSTLAHASPNPRALVERIIALGNERGGPDNLTAVALFY